LICLLGGAGAGGFLGVFAVGGEFFVFDKSVRNIPNMSRLGDIVVINIVFITGYGLLKVGNFSSSWGLCLR
jgi:hypothetical protein